MIHAKDLTVEYLADQGATRALDGMSLEVGVAEVVGVVGESGSGKSTLGLVVGRLLPPNALHVGGDLIVDGHPVFHLTDEQLRGLRRHALGFVFQNPIAALDPTKRIGRQMKLTTAIQSVDGLCQLLRRVGLPDPSGILTKYPHELSGGMAQRVVIAMATARKPKVLVADEPTASLDASIRSNILDLLVELSARDQMAVLLASHDLSSVAKYCSRVAVMYAGRVVEEGTNEDVFGTPVHPYTKALLASVAGSEGVGGRIEPIPGSPPVLKARSESCAFHPRCRFVDDVCRSVRPEERIFANRRVLCHLVEEINSAVSPH